MLAFEDQLADPLEALHVFLLGRGERVRPEMGKNLLHQITDVSNLELESSVGSVGPDETTSPPLSDNAEELSSFRVLADREARPNLPTESMSSTRLERDAEAAFSIDES
jgi:hypothetical protein